MLHIFSSVSVGGLWPPTIWYRFAYAAYILLCVRLSPSSLHPLTLFPLLSPPSLSLSSNAFGVGLRLQRGFASDRPLATIWYRSAAFLATCGIRIDHYIRDLPSSQWSTEWEAEGVCRPGRHFQKYGESEALNASTTKSLNASTTK